MNDLRPLLRLEDKVAAEGRRLQDLGGPSMRWVAPTVLIVAATLHGAILLLPAPRIPPTLAAASAVPDFPLVWRRAPAPVQPPEPPATRPTVAAPTERKPIPIRRPATAIARSLTTEPVPEPAPDVALNTFSAEIEAIIPNPDTPPPALELGPPSGGVAAQPSDAPPTLVESVKPVYPVAARSLRAEGHVKVRLAVLPDGSVGEATVFACSRRGVGFEAAALNAVKRWRYAPAPLQSDSRSVIVTIHFQLPEGRP